MTCFLISLAGCGRSGSVEGDQTAIAVAQEFFAAQRITRPPTTPRVFDDGDDWIVRYREVEGEMGGGILLVIDKKDRMVVMPCLTQ